MQLMNERSEQHFAPREQSFVREQGGGHLAAQLGESKLGEVKLGEGKLGKVVEAAPNMQMAGKREVEKN